MKSTADHKKGTESLPPPPKSRECAARITRSLVYGTSARKSVLKGGFEGLLCAVRPIFPP